MHIDNEILSFRIQDGELRVRQGETARPDVRLYASMPDYMGLLGGALEAGDAVAKGLIRVEGDLEALRRFLALCRLPETIGG